MIVSGSVLAPVVREGVHCQFGLVGDGGGLSSPSSENTWMISSSWNLRCCGGCDGPAQGLIIRASGLSLVKVPVLGGGESCFQNALGKWHAPRAINI